MAYSATKVFPAEVWAATNTSSCCSKCSTARFWKLSRVNGNCECIKKIHDMHLLDAMELRTSSAIFGISLPGLLVSTLTAHVSLVPATSGGLDGCSTCVCISSSKLDYRQKNRRHLQQLQQQPKLLPAVRPLLQ